MAEWFDASGVRGGGVAGAGGPVNVGVYRDPDVNPDYYQYHYTIIRVGNKGDGGPVPASIKVASSNGDVDTLAVKEWIAQNPPKPTAPLTGFVTHYNNWQEAYGKMRALAQEFPNISEAVKLPEPTRGYQRRAADDARLHERDGHRADRDGRVRPLRRQQPARGGRDADHGPAGQHGRPDLQELRSPGQQQPHRPDRRPRRRG